MMRLRLVLLILPVVCLLGFARKPGKDPDFLNADMKWVDSVFNSLSPNQRLAQLFMVQAYSNKDLKHVKEIRDLVVDQGIGGLIWMQGGPLRQGMLANYYQSIAKVPLLYSIDGEWGLAMRIDSTPRYPRQMTLGAIQNDSLIYYMGKQIAKECKRIGIHVNFAPVADVNNNKLNPVIGMRSFGEDKNLVARKAYMYMQGMQDEHVMANGKHFPGHGDTESDSHSTLPLISHTRARIDSLELFPFRYLFDKGLASVMVAHLNIPHLDTTKSQASTLSDKIVNGLLKKELGFRGLIFTDALTMKGVTIANKPGYVDAKALIAGNDIMLCSENVSVAIQEVNKAVDEGKITRTELDDRCKKVLKAKYWCGLRKKASVLTLNLLNDLNTKESEVLNDKLAGAAVTLLKNDGILPLRGLDTLRVTSVSIGNDEANIISQTLRGYCYTEHVGLAPEPKPAALADMFEAVKDADIVVIQLNRSTIKPDNAYGAGVRNLKIIDSLAHIKSCILVLNANPYLLNTIDTRPFKAVITGYEFTNPLLKADAEIMLGIRGASGKLPISAGPYKCGAGIDLPALASNAVNERREIYKLQKFGEVDSLAMSGIAEKAYPGCQVVAMKDGSVVYQKSFGNFTYNSDSKPVDNGTMYDLASLTKIAGSSLALMKLRSEGKFDYKKTLADYLPELKETDKGGMLIEDVLAHQAGLQAWIPFFLKTIEANGKFKPGFYSKTKTDEYPVPVASNLFANAGIKDTIYRRIAESKTEKPGKYLYSDLGYYYMQEVIERQSGMKLDEFVQDLYAKTGIGLRYHPLKYFSKLQITPTENDSKFRKQILQGYVHDPGAAMLGGVAGHAGLFGNALDVAKLMQLYLNLGELDGVRLIDSNVVREFTSCRFCPGNRRGLCFDMPEPDLKKDNPVTSECSAQSFGHSGFTGTFAWADPINKLVVVFLSNRVFPTSEDNKLTKLGIRGKIHKAFYDALKQQP
jgi:beta-N-acetylhexosaminidase